MRLTKPVMLLTDKYTYRQIKGENEKNKSIRGDYTKTPHQRQILKYQLSHISCRLNSCGS